MTGPPLDWIVRSPASPYFARESGHSWTPIGQNDAISWPELEPLFRRRDLPAVERHLRWLKAHGVTCLRLMIEYAQVRHRYFDRPAGRPVPAMVRLWDDLFALCERVGLRILLTPVDTFWMWLHWRHHPWSRAQGGPLEHPSRLLLCADTRAAIKARLDFIIRRWGGSGVLFAWDLWNEIHPGQSEGRSDNFGEFIADLSGHVRRLEQELYGRTHPQTVSLYGPELWQMRHLPMAEPIFRHPDLDFASIHIYRSHSIDNPRNTVAAAVAMGQIVRSCLGEITDDRPFLDTEHGPIHRFKDKKKTLPEAFDDEYFRHMSWAHLASGGVGGGMRWPNRHPHVLTPGMRRAQKAMADFLPLVDWASFARRIVTVKVPGFHAFACGDEDQAIVYLLRRGATAPDGRIDPARVTPEGTVAVPRADGRYRVIGWNTETGAETERVDAASIDGTLAFTTRDLRGDRAFAIRRHAAG